jgi:hypothetical protein
MGRSIVPAAIRLDLDDPPDPVAPLVLAHQPGAQQRAGDIGRRAGELSSIEDGQPRG